MEGAPAEWTDDALDQMIDAMDKMSSKNGGPEKSFEEQLAELENHPAFMKEIDPSKPLTAEMEGLMQMKYENEDPVAKAEAYKEDGNYEFKKKKYRIAIDNYTEGIKCKCPDQMLNAVLYCNRAAAQFYLGNYRTSYNDCVFARKFKKDHMKAINRGALCCLQMKKYEECIKWCDEALQIDPKDGKILEMRTQAVKEQKTIERDKRKEKLQERKALSADIKLLQTIKSRGIKLSRLNPQSVEDQESDSSLLASLETHHPSGAKVHLDSNNVLYWPVMFLYPEHTETDFIQMFSENHRFIDHLNHMFGLDVDPPPWDTERHYKPHVINVYFEDKEREKLHKVNKEWSLLKALQHDRYRVYGGTPAFIITVAGSVFEKSFLEKYNR